MYTKLTPPTPSFENFITTIINREQCNKHDAMIGMACFYVPHGLKGGGLLAAVCNRRAKRAGFNHPISEKALRVNQKISRR